MFGYWQGGHGDFPFNALILLVPAAGLEPARPFGLEILSLLCLPFHHAGGGATLSQSAGRGKGLADIFAHILANSPQRGID